MRNGDIVIEIRTTGFLLPILQWKTDSVGDFYRTAQMCRTPGPLQMMYTLSFRNKVKQAQEILINDGKRGFETSLPFNMWMSFE